MIREYKGFKIISTKGPKGFVRENPYTFFIADGAATIKHSKTLKIAKAAIDLYNEYGIEKAVREGKL